MTTTEPAVDVLVVGAGVSGIGAGIALQRNGFTFRILERADEVGGTWRDHRYPGLTVDIPSLTYSFSYAQKPDWSSLWAPQSEVLDYCRSLVDEYGIRGDIAFGQSVTEARFDTATHVWRVRTADGTEHVGRYLINGSGYLSVPKRPAIEGIDTFGGRHLHTSEWAPDTSVRGERVAFIGTGATAIQLAPELAADTERMHVFQRTPIWLLPKPPMTFGPRLQKAFRRVPGLQRIARLGTAAFMDLVFFRVFTDYRQVSFIGRLAEKLGRAHITKHVDDPDTAARLIPEYSWGCKRPSFSNSYYPMFNRPNVELVTDPITKVTPTAVVTADGTEREVDTIVYATGYQPFEKAALPTYPVHGPDGELQEYWDRERYQAFRGFTVSGFPNFFMIFGPYSIASPSYFAMVEVATRNIIKVLRHARDTGATSVQATPQSQQAELQQILERKAGSVWVAANCGGSNSYYLDRFGDTPGFRPSYHHQEWLASRTMAMRHFRFDTLTSDTRDAATTPVG